jgi:hypothetical protein
MAHVEVVGLAASDVASDADMEGQALRRSGRAINLRQFNQQKAAQNISAN